MTARPRVLILGAGFGGLSAAHAFKELAVEADVLVVDRSPNFSMGLRKLWLLDGRSRRGEGRRPRAVLNKMGIPFRQGDVEEIDLEGHRVGIDGEALPWDFLIVALGAEPRIDLVKGADAAGPNIYSWDGAAEAGERLREIQAGRIAIVIAGLPIKCPPAPYEAAFLIDDALRQSHRRDRVELEVITPQPMSIPAAGSSACTSVEDEMADRGIHFRPNAAVERFEPGRVVAGGQTIDADLFLVVPPHRPPRVVKESGLTGDGEWVPVDPKILRTNREGVYAVGDIIEMKTGTGLPFPKAGVFAEQHGRVAAENIAAQLAGSRLTRTFEGDGYCFLELGGGQASMVKGNFLTAPPDVEIGIASPMNLQAKRDFETERLDRWLPNL